jgi:hypothetical protein
MALGVGLRRRMPRVALSGIALRLRVGAALMVSLVFSVCETRLGQPDGISPSRMAEMLEVDKAGPKVRC